MDPCMWREGTVQSSDHIMIRQGFCLIFEWKFTLNSFKKKSQSKGVCTPGFKFRYLCLNNGYWRTEKELNAVLGRWIIELTCSLKQVGKCTWRAARACLHICFLYCLLYRMCLWPLHVKDSSGSQMREHWHDSFQGQVRGSRHTTFRTFRSLSLLHVKDHSSSSSSSSDFCPKACLFRAFQKGPESDVHRELLVFGPGADQAGEQRPRHSQRHLQQQRHCPAGARGRGCHQTFQKGQNLHCRATRWPFPTHEVTPLICSNRDWRHANQCMQKYVYVYDDVLAAYAAVGSSLVLFLSTKECVRLSRHKRCSVQADVQADWDIKG